MLETLNPILYRVSLLCYNKSHVPAVINYTRSDDKGLGATAHELLKEISTKHPKVFSTHVKDLCRTLENESPTAKTPNPPGAVDDLKACAAFAKKFPTDIPMNGKESRKLVQSFLNFALYGTPPQAAKHAITIIMNSDNKKEMHAKEILTKSIKNFEYNGDHWLTKLAALSQLVLLAQPECEDDMDSIVEIAIQKILQKPHSATANTDEAWIETPDDDIQGRTWAVKILVNRLRSLPAESDINEAATATYAMLNRWVKNDGEGSDDNSTPTDHKNRQRLLAANSLLKLSSNPRLEKLLKPVDFNQLALVTHDFCFQVRKGFADKLMKYLGQNRLPSRFYAILFFLAYEPERAEKIGFETWIRSRQAAKALQKDTTLELVFPRLLSLLAHHPDFDTENETLKLMSEYILFYLKCVATKDNISLIHHVAQRVKSVADGIEPSAQADKNLYVLSSLSDALITAWTEQKGWSLETWPGKTGLPSAIFRPLKSHDQAQEIADKQWLDDTLIEELDPLVRKAIRSKKRRANDGDERKSRKKVKSEKTKRVKADRPIKTPRKKKRTNDDDDDEESDADGRPAPSSEPRRKSGRHSIANKSYIEVSSDEEDVQAGAEEADEEEDAETSEANDQSSPPPEEDVEMEDQDTIAVDIPTKEPADEVEAEDSDLSEPEASPEPSPEPEPPKKTTRAKSAKTTNGAKSSPVTQKRKTETALPARPAKTTAKSKTKAKATETTIPSSPAANGTRRSTRTRG